MEQERSRESRLRKRPVANSSRTSVVYRHRYNRLKDYVRDQRRRIKMNVRERNLKLEDPQPIDPETVWRRIAYREMLDREKAPMKKGEMEHVVEIRTVTTHSPSKKDEKASDGKTKKSVGGDCDYMYEVSDIHCLSDKSIQIDNATLDQLRRKQVEAAHWQLKNIALYCTLTAGKVEADMKKFEEKAKKHKITQTKKYYASLFTYSDTVALYIMFLIAATFAFRVTDDLRGQVYRTHIMKSIDSYHQAKELGLRPLRYHKLTLPSHILPWIKNHLLPLIYESRHREMPSKTKDSTFPFDWLPSVSNDSQDSLLTHHNTLIGSPTIRQVRVKKASCVLPYKMKGLFSDCTSYFDESREERRNAGNASLYKYSKVGTEIRGYFGTYPAKGYAYVFGFPKDTFSMLAYMEYRNWIDMHTRAVIVEFLLYNPHIDVFAYTRLLFELPPVGGVFARTYVDLIELSAFPTTEYAVRYAFEIILIIIMIMMTVSLVLRILYQPLYFFMHWWNYMDIVIVIAGLFYILFTVLFIKDTIILRKEMADLSFEQHYLNPPVQNIIDSNNYRLFWAMVLCCLMAMKTFHLLTVLEPVSSIFDALTTGIQNLLVVSFFGVIILLCQGIGGMILFGHQEREFSTVWQTFKTVFLIYLGTFSVGSLMIETPITGTLFLTIYYVFVSCLFMGMLYTIFIFHFSDVFSSQNRHEGRPTLRSAYSNMYKHLFKRPLPDVVSLIKKLFKVKVVGKEITQIVDVLKRKGFKNKEIKIYLKVRRIHPDRKLSDERMVKEIRFIEESERQATLGLQYRIFFKSLSNMESRVEYFAKVLAQTTNSISDLIRNTEKAQSSKQM